MNHSKRADSPALIGVGLNLLSLLFSSLAPVLNKFALVKLNPIAGGVLTSVFAAGLTGLVILGRSRRLTLVANPYFLLLGATNAVGILLQYVALSLLSPVTVTLIARVYLIYVFLLSVAFLGERLRKWDYVAIVACLAGSLLVSGGRAQFDNGWGLLSAFLYPLMYAANNILAKLLVATTPADATLFYNHSVSALLLLLLSPLVPHAWQGLSLVSVSFNFFGAVCNGFLSLLLFYTSLKFISAGHANIVRALGPLIVIAYSAVFFPVQLTGSLVAGALLLLVATALVTFQRA